MADIAPFQGIRYNRALSSNLNQVTSPPYDVISPEDCAYYHSLHPNNFVRLILGEERESDSASDNRFTRAHDYLSEWLAEGVLVRDPVPAIYIYQQRFEQDGAWKTVCGLLPAVKLHEYSEKVILPHETTLSKPKSQLLELMRATRANLDPVYGLYADEEGVLDEVISRAKAEPPLGEASDKNDVVHTLWAVTDAPDIEKIVGFFADKQIAIADGHHRYETALAFRNEMRRRVARSVEDLPWDFALMTLVNVHQKDITVYPTHRVVADLPETLVEGLDQALAQDFLVEPSSEKTLIADMADRMAIGVYRAGTAITLKLKHESESKLKGSEASRELELNILHDLILESALGIHEENLRNQTNIYYTHDSSEAIERVDRGESQVAFLLNHIPVKTVLEIALAGERVPQKATYFYPKLLSGLVLRKM